MISYQEAMRILLSQQAATPQTEKLPLLAALGKTAADDVAGMMNIPSFRNSAMDGFAVRCADIASATPSRPVIRPVLRAIAAGDIVKMEAESGVVQIMTGTLVPELYDAVVPLEDVTLDGDMVAFRRPAKAHENIRFPGEDVRLGQVALRRGDIVSAERSMLLAALGVAEVKVYKLPALHILSTGKEITDHANAPLPEGKIHNANAPYLLARCQEEGFTAHYGGMIADDAEEFEERIRAVPADSVVITTGAVSKGAWDFIPASLNRLGAVTHFHRVNIRPGKPVLFATLPGGGWFFGLPGNPVSAAIGFRFFVLPLMRALQGRAPERPIMAKLENGLTKKGDFRQFLKAKLQVNSCGELFVAVSCGQESFKISPMAESNAWAVVEEDRLKCAAGAPVAVFPFADRLGQVLDKPVLTTS